MNEKQRTTTTTTSSSPATLLKHHSKSKLLMWALSISLCSILALVLTGKAILSAGGSSHSHHGSKAQKAAAAAAEHDRHTALSRAAKVMKKVTKPKVAKLIDAKNINRGADGTVVKDMDRGPPLKETMPEDADDDEEWDDDQWYETDEDKKFEEKELEKKKKENDQKELLDKKKENHVDFDVAAAFGDALKEEKNKLHEKNKEEAALKQSEGETEGKVELTSDAATPAEDNTAKKVLPKDVIEQLKEEAEPTVVHERKKKKTPKKTPPRKWESNAEAVMKIIDVDAHPHMELDDKGKLVQHPEEEDSSDDEESEEEEEDESHKYTYLKLPNLATLSATDAASQILSTTNGITNPLHDRLSSMFEKATSHECRAKIAEHFSLFVNGLAQETKFPFEDFYYPNTCTAIPRYGDWENLPPGVKVQDVQYRVYQPPKEEVPEGTYLENVEELQLLYVILTHDQPEATIRLMESVYVPNVTKYVIHVDGKERADATYQRLVQYAQEKNEYAMTVEGKEQEYIRIVPNHRRVRVNWGGFSMVDATLKALQTVFGLDYYDEHPEEKGGDSMENPHAFKFHKLVHLASTTYPLASNTEIRDTLSSFPLDANFLHIILRPNNPTPSVWNYFVECDDALHRIYRIPALHFDKGNGVDIYTSSQWFIISREFAWYLAKPPKESFVEYYLEYIEHVVVADESFFGTVIRNTHFCSTLHNDNFLHLQFDRWENEATGARDQRKCVMKNRDHCGRSPTTMTVDYLPVLELSGDLFARKFDDIAEPLVKDYIDNRRAKEEERFKREAELMKEKNTTELPLEEYEFQGEGVLLVAKETVMDDVPLCMGLAEEGNTVMLQPCFKDDVPATLSPEWEAGAVIIEEIEGLNRWDIGPCSSDGELKRNTTGELEMIPGIYSEKGPSCGIKSGDGPRQGRCLDVESGREEPGGMVNVFPCYTRWHQLFSFGNGNIAPRGAIHASLPAHIAKQRAKKKEEEVHQHLCLGVVGRGDLDEHWIEYDEQEMEEWDPWEYPDVPTYPSGRKSLQLWSGQQLQTTPCSNEGGVIEFFFVPFIVEEYDDDESKKEDTNETADVAEEDDEEL